MEIIPKTEFVEAQTEQWARRARDLPLGEGIFGLAWLKLFFVVWSLLILPSQVSANIGRVIGVKQGAEITRAGKSQPVRAGMEIESGDSISTDQNGVVQLIFVDETKIAIGPNARMMLDVTMLRGNRKAKNFAVQALGGSFRFISGKSKKRAYSIQTPTATMAVRGTTFDMWVVPGTQSAMLVLDGRVEMCSLSGNCQSTGRQCSLMATTQSGGVGRPADQAQYEKALENGFPFIQSQESLLAPLQVDVGGCGTESLPPLPVKSDAPEPEPEQPEQGEVQSAATSASRSEPPARESPSSGSGNGGNIGGGIRSGNGNGGNIGGGSGTGGNGTGGSIGNVSGGGADGSGGTIGDSSDGNFGGSVGSGGTNGNGGNSGGN